MPLPVTILYLIYALVGVFAILTIALKPKLFWPFLIVATVATGGLMVEGHGLVEEYLVDLIILGALLALSIGAIHLKKQKEDKWETLHRVIFIIFIMYMLVQSVRGLLVLHDPRIIRWIFFYGFLGLLTFIITKKGFPIPNARKTSIIVSVSTLIYLIAYLLVGIIYESITGSSRWDLQGYIWAGSAGAVFPLVVAMPAALFLIRSKIRNDKIIAWLVIIMGMVITHYYSARSAAVMIFAFLIIALFTVKFRKVLILIIIFAVLTMFFGIGNTLTEYTHGIAKSAVLKSNSETGRLNFIYAAINAIEKNVITFLFGYGMYTNRYIISPYLYDLGYFGSGPMPKIARTSGFSAQIIDVGLIGFLLFYLNIFFVARRVLFLKHNLNRLSILLALGMICLWPIISNIYDVLLLYLLIMPAGLFIQLSKTPLKELTK